MNFLSLILIISILGCEFKEGENQIINGFEISQRIFKHHVSLLVNGATICMGAIIDTNHVITAAHCVVLHWKINTIVIIAGSTEFGNSGRTVRLVKKCFIPENFHNTSSDDIAVLKLHIPFVFGENIGAVTLPSAPVPNEDAICLFIGFVKNGSRVIDWKLSWTALQVIPNIVCECMIQLLLHPHTFCAIDVNEIQPTPGDSGSVLICDGVAIGIFFGRAHNGMYTPNLFNSIYGNLKFIRAAIESTID